jgi:DNA polymerase-4
MEQESLRSAKTYFHVDMDAFFVSVEELLDPSLKGKAVVVGGRPNERGVVSAASYAARKFGVHSAMPLRTAARLCPHAIFLNGHPELYREYSKKAFGVFMNFTPLADMASIDEAYLDMTGTGRLHGPPLRAAHLLHERMKTKTGLNCSIGISSSRMVAKVASDQAKPNGVLFVLSGHEARFLAPLEVRKIPGVGKVTEHNLHACGIRRVGDLAALDERFLEKRFGKWGLALAGKSKGLDAGGWFDEEVGAGGDPKSISHEHTFDEDSTDVERLESTLARLSEMVARRLREHELFARTIQLKLRYSDFSTITRAHSLGHATQLDTEIFSAILGLFRDNYDRAQRVRLLGVHASGLDRGTAQMRLVDDNAAERWASALSAVDRLRDKYGESAVALARGMTNRIRERVHENPAGLPGRGRSER